VKELLGSCPDTSSQEVVFAWQSIKKLLPNSCSCMERPLVEAVAASFGRPSRTLPSGYVSFLKRETRRLFRKGWDSSLYEERVLTCSPSLSGTLECPRSQGGCLGSGLDHSSFIDVCLTGSSTGRSTVEAELLVVQSAGKPRPLTKFSSDSLCLKPLHTSVYDHLRRQRWLSVGDVTQRTLARAGFSRAEGEVLTSGDYKSATDNLSIEAAEVILETILEGAISPSPFVREYALASLRPTLGCKKLGIQGLRPKVGQMMGSFLSFPLLCLQNRFAFLWALQSSGLSPKESERTPCLINGDDILFSSTPRVSESWMGVVSALGLEVERTKTSVSESFGSLNSTLLRWRGSALVVVPTLRFGRLRTSEYVTSLSREFRLWLCGSGARRFREGVVFFKRHLRLLRSTRLTLLEIGFRGTLAHRMAEVFSLVPCEPPRFKAPPPPVGHSIVLQSDFVTRVPVENLGEELSQLNARELASWKFSSEFFACQESAVLQYCLSLSSVRAPARLDVIPFREVGFVSRLTPLGAAGTRRQVADWFAQPLEPGERGVPVFDRILALQALVDYDDRAPPSYQETVWSEWPKSVDGVLPPLGAVPFDLKK